MVKQKDDLTRWRKKLQESLRDLSKLHAELKEAKCYNMLKIYLRSKDLEIQNSKQSIKTNHIAKINTFYHMDYENLRKTFALACEIIQRNYLILKYDNGVDSDLQDKLDKLCRLMNGHGIKFKDSDNKDSEDDLELTFDNNLTHGGENNVEIQLNGKRIHSSDEDEKVSSRKRSKKLFEDTIDLFTQNEQSGSDGLNHIGACLDETQVLTTANDTDNGDSTFDTINGKNKKIDFISNILSEQNVSTMNRAQIKNVLLKSNITREAVLKTVSAGIQKENKKYSPNRIRKSPRTGNITTRALTSTANFLRRQKAKTSTPSSTEPAIVRINRTASLRIKK